MVVRIGCEFGGDCECEYYKEGERIRINPEHINRQIYNCALANTGMKFILNGVFPMRRQLNSICCLRHK